MNKDVPIFYGEMKGTNVRLYLPEKYEQWKAQLKDRKIELILREHKAVRSPNQNRYLHYVFGVIADYTGHTADEVKVRAKQLFASSVDSHGIPFLEHTAKMDTERCSKFTEDVMAWASMEFGLVIKSPDEFARSQEL